MAIRRFVHSFVLVASVGLIPAFVPAAEFVLVERGVSLTPIIVASNAPAATAQAAGELADYIEKISGARPEIIAGAPAPIPEHAVWVGGQPELTDLFPDVQFDFQYPEEILHLCNGRHLLIAGRDRMAGEKQTEHGTANSIYTFIEKRLDVRWLWPGELGEDIIKKETLAFPAFEYRHHPVFLKRHFYTRQPEDWHRHQRLLHYSDPFASGDAFGDWWDKYHETHPEYFALQPNGTRTPPRGGSTAKLCLSNPGVWSQWLDHAEQTLRADPSITTLRATPTDGPWHCTCENCRAWDHPDAPARVLTERHVKFWNILARGLRERFPERDVYVDATAYAAYLTPPVAERLEKNIAIKQVGHFPLTSEANREQAKKEWRQWADKATLMSYRPNLWYWAGGVWGFPEVAMKKTIEDFRFLADNKCIGITVDVLRHVWATQGPQYYLMAQLTYDPYQDGAAVMKDYYRRGFGPAADDIDAYWTLMEEARDAIVSQPDFALGTANRYKLPAIFARVYSEEWMGRVEDVLQQAEARAADSDLYRRRVAFVRAGFDYTRLLVRTIPLMTRLRDSQAKDTEAIRQAQENWNAIEQLCNQTEPWGLGFRKLCTWMHGTSYQGRMQDYFGPPSEELLGKQAQEPIRLRPAQWTLTFADDFQRPALGPDWEIQGGAWRVENGCLVSTGGGRLISARKFPGLHKVTFDAVVEPNPGVSDISPFIQAGPQGPGSGYLLQFGGNYNTGSAIQKEGKVVRQSQRTIEPGQVHAIVAEYDGTAVRLTVDGKGVAEYPDEYPLIDAGHDRIGFYTYEGALKISNLNVYTSKAVQAKTFANGGEGEGFE